MLWPIQTAPGGRGICTGKMLDACRRRAGHRARHVGADERHGPCRRSKNWPRSETRPGDWRVLQLSGSAFRGRRHQGWGRGSAVADIAVKCPTARTSPTRMVAAHRRCASGPGAAVSLPGKSEKRSIPPMMCHLISPRPAVGHFGCIGGASRPFRAENIGNPAVRRCPLPRSVQRLGC